MKRTRAITQLLTVLLLAGCSQTEVTDVNPDSHPAVGFGVYTGLATRGAVSYTHLDWMVKANATAPAINVFETEKEYKVELAAPGMTKDCLLYTSTSCRRMV